MQTTLFKQNPLVPSLPDASAPKTVKHDLSKPGQELRGGDQLHVKFPLLGFPKGMVLPVCGYRTLHEPDGTLYAVTAYVLPLAHTRHAVAFMERDAKRFPSALQRERFFGTAPVCLVEIDLTENRDCLRLERAPEAVAERLGYDQPVSQDRDWTRRAWIQDDFTMSLAA